MSSKYNKNQEYDSEEDEDFVPDDKDDEVNQELYEDDEDGAKKSKSKKKTKKSKDSELISRSRPKRKGPFDSEDEFSEKDDSSSSEEAEEPSTKKHKSSETFEESSSKITEAIEISPEVGAFYASMMKGKPSNATQSTTVQSITSQSTISQSTTTKASIVETNNQKVEEKASSNSGVESTNQTSDANQSKDPLAFFAMMKKSSDSSNKPSSSSNTSPKLAIPSSWLSPAPKTEPIARTDTSSQSTTKLTPVEKVSITETYDYAGEKIQIERKVDASEAAALAAKRGGSGLGSLLDQLKGKNKLSSIQKSKIDWSNFTEEEGLEDEFEKHKKDGYLQKQAFLHQADLAQFELEKSVRDRDRSKRKL